MPKMPSISAALIVRDEEQYLSRCLSSIQGLVSEIVVVDTGSKDKTMSIARRYGAKVFEFSWCDDFAAARNFSIEKCSEEWILVIDADELIRRQDHEELTKLIANKDCCFRLTQRHYSNNTQSTDFELNTGENPDLEQGSGFFESGCVRLFPNNPAIRYEGVVHELVEPCLKRLKSFKIVDSEVRLHHYGHLDSERRHLRHELYTRLGEKKAEQGQNDWKALYELGVQENQNANYPKAIEYLEQAVKLNPNFDLGWVNLGYVLVRARRAQDAVSVLQQGLKRFPQSSELFGNLGYALMTIGNHAAAERAFEHALERNKDYVLAKKNLVLARLKLGKLQEARELAEETLTLIEDDVELHNYIGFISLVRGEHNKAEQHLLSVKKLNPNFREVYLSLFQLYKACGNFTQAAESLDEFCKRSRGFMRPESLKKLESEVVSLRAQR